MEKSLFVLIILFYFLFYTHNNIFGIFLLAILMLLLGLYGYHII